MRQRQLRFGAVRSQLEISKRALKTKPVPHSLSWSDSNMTLINSGFECMFPQLVAHFGEAAEASGSRSYVKEVGRSGLLWVNF